MPLERALRRRSRSARHHVARKGKSGSAIHKPRPFVLPLLKHAKLAFLHSNDSKEGCGDGTNLWLRSQGEARAVIRGAAKKAIGGTMEIRVASPKGTIKIAQAITKGTNMARS